MTEEEWLSCNSVWDIFGRFDFEASPRKLRLFSVACCRCSCSLLLNAEHYRAVNLAERFADGLATEQELRVAYERARDIVAELRAGSTEPERCRWAESVAVLCATNLPEDRWREDQFRNAASETGWHIVRATSSERVDAKMASLLRDIVGNALRPVSRLNPDWLTSDVTTLAQKMYDTRDFSKMPILADALQNAGCENTDILNHCRDKSIPHVRGCWVVDLILVKG